MKLFKLIMLVLVLTGASVTKAQVSVNVNIGTPPVWGPAGHAGCRYYYLPDIQTYYDVNTAMFIYAGPRGWVHASVLPEIYAGFDLNSGCKVVLNLRGDD